MCDLSQGLVCESNPGCTLCADVFQCKACQNQQYGFTPTNQAVPPSFRFPALIGCTAKDFEPMQKDILFVGINPRCSRSNQALHNSLVSSFADFVGLARNQYPAGLPGGFKKYIAPNGPEPHYYPHVKIVEKLFGQGVPFEDHAAVTELFLCASGTSQGVNASVYQRQSACADQFLKRVLALIKPKAIVAIGAAVKGYFAAPPAGGNGIPVIAIPHPGDYWHYTDAQHAQALEESVEKLSGILKGQVPLAVTMPEPSVPEVVLAEVDELPEEKYWQMVKRSDDGDTSVDHRWCINADRVPADHHGVVQRDTIKLQLSIAYPFEGGMPRDNPHAVYVGTYCLDLPALLAGGYVRAEANDRYRLRFVALEDGVVYIEANQQGGKLPIGNW